MAPPVKLSPFAETIFKRTYASTPDETWEGCAKRVAKFVSNGDNDLEKRFFDIIITRKFIPGGRYLANAGRELPQIGNCFMFKAEDSREGWGNLLYKHTIVLGTGGGAGTWYGDIRARGTPIGRMGGEASGAVSLAKMVNSMAREMRAGGSRRSALIALLPWDHLDIDEFINAKNWTTELKAIKERDIDFPAPLDMTNISVCLDDNFFKVIKTDRGVRTLYDKIVKSAMKTGEPGFSINIGKESNTILRNPCAEVCSADTNDVCNLGSIVLPNIKDINELEEITTLATEFLILGTMVGWVPHKDIEDIRTKNRRIGLGFMGLHDWLLKNGLKYEPNGLLGRWLSVWQGVSDETANKIAIKYNIAPPMGRRAVAPTGTISICAETTSGIEPIFCSAYKRRYMDHGKFKYQYVIDPVANKAIKEYGINPDDIEDAESLAQDVERRLSMQAFVEDYVDMAVSSTINLPEYGEPGNNNSKKFGDLLLKYLPRLRGVTLYPDGARSGQPITKIKYETAKAHEGVVYEELEASCIGGVCGI